ncbi:MAG TPA: DUF3551 domain-containing protein [Xanthobacteraceae bacterium]|jgi:hypothetical protein
MRKLALATITVAVALASATSPGRAQYYPWCLIISDKTGSWSCYFATRDQCMMSAGGNVGFCAQNPAYRDPPPPARRHRRTNG